MVGKRVFMGGKTCVYENSLYFLYLKALKALKAHRRKKSWL